MKKLIRKILVLALCVTAVFGLVACGKKDSDSGKVAEYANQVRNSAQFKSVQSSLKNQNLEVNIKNDGTALVYEYKFLIDMSDSEIKAAKAQIEANSTTVVKTMKSTLDSIKKEAPVSKVVYVYYAKSGEKITSIDVK